MSNTDYSDVFRLLELALNEDIGTGDATSQLCVPADRKAVGRYFAREPMVVAGIELLKPVFTMRGGVDYLELKANTGDAVDRGQMLAEVRGFARTLLECERVSLNLMQRLSGVATLSRHYAQAVAHTKCQVLDTRKTTPGLRRLEKMAAAAGGITNHRMGLYDAVLIKNNHIAAAGGVAAALRNARDTDLPVEIEIRTRAELDEALANGAEHVLLDNLTPEQAAEEIAYINGRAKVELSGNINIDTVKAYAETGADFVSCGAVTHSVRSVDINFRLELE